MYKRQESLFSFNSTGACPVCGGKGVIVTELAFMDPVVTECEACGGVRYNEEALACRYQGKNIVELLGLTASQAMEIFEDSKIRKHLKVMQQVGLSLSLIHIWEDSEKCDGSKHLPIRHFP